MVLACAHSGVAGRWWPRLIMAVLNSGSSKDHASYEELVLYCGSLPNIVKGLSCTCDAISRNNLSLFLLAAGSGLDPDPSSGATRGAPGKPDRMSACSQLFKS